MNFADLKNDSIFRRIFATNPSLLQELLNDLLERTGDQTIEGIEYLPKGQLPLVAGAKLSILDVLCRDRTGAYFVVEIQLIHMAGFIHRVTYRGYKAEADQPEAGETDARLMDVVVISICDFELWPDAEQDDRKLPRIPMLSQWYMTESLSSPTRPPEQNESRLLQVQYTFLELPKLPESKPTTGAAQWAWLFVHALQLTAIPADLPAGPFREALELASEATFTRSELDAYRKVTEEIQQARDYGAGQRAEGKAEGKAEAKAEGKAEAIVAILTARGIAVDDAGRARITGCSDMVTLDRWLVRAIAASCVDEVVNSS